jgi:broad specificity phosphatase PhoE
MSEKYPSEHETYKRTAFYNAIPGGETAKQRLDRSVQVLTAIAERHSDQTVVVVTHGGFLMGSPHRDPATFYEKFDRSELCRSNVVKVNIVTR